LSLLAFVGAITKTCNSMSVVLYTFWGISDIPLTCALMSDWFERMMVVDGSLPAHVTSPISFEEDKGEIVKGF